MNVNIVYEVRKYNRIENTLIDFEIFAKSLYISNFEYEKGLTSQSEFINLLKNKVGMYHAGDEKIKSMIRIHEFHVTI